MIIVGAGMAGASLAYELAAQPLLSPRGALFYATAAQRDRLDAFVAELGSAPSSSARPA
ncbi:MAG: hypothetical protein AB7G13_13210 [Lautropia sp.]